MPGSTTLSSSDRGSEVVGQHARTAGGSVCCTLKTRLGTWLRISKVWGDSVSSTQAHGDRIQRRRAYYQHAFVEGRAPHARVRAFLLTLVMPRQRVKGGE